MGIAIAPPRLLGAGGNIRVISPGLPGMVHAPERARRAEDIVTSWGFNVSYGTHAFSVTSDGTMAGTASQRAADLMAAFEDPSVDAVLASISGLGSQEMLPYLDATVIAESRKPFIGYCDNVFLSQYLASHCGLGSYLGCCFIIHMGEPGEGFPEMRNIFQAAVMNSGRLTCRPVGTRTNEWFDWEDKPRTRSIPGGWDWIRPGRGEGTFIGGEISILPELIREFDLLLDSSVLFWEVSPSNNLPLCAQFEDLLSCADLSRISGMIVGADANTEPREWAHVVSHLVDDMLPEAEFPVLVNADLGHLHPGWIVPYGETVVIGDEVGVVFPRDDR